jgi:anti-sigma factor RsiW
VDCRQTQNLIDGYLDGELDLVRHLEIERHIADCPACREIFANRRALSGALRAHATYHAAPATMAARVRAALNQAAEPPPATFKPLSPRWLSLAASVAFAAFLGAGVTYWVAQPSPDEWLAREAVAGHVRSLMVAGRSTDVSSSDQHTVKPWFNGKLDFSPPVLDLTGEGFTLVGGRLDYLASHPVAALVYRHRQHVINLFIWPGTDSADRPLQTRSHQGYQVMHWTQAGMIYWTVSDLNPANLQTFSALIQKQTASR